MSAWHLVNFCPHDLFHNTRSDLGPCPNEHVDALREPYLAESASASTLAARFEAEYLAYLERLLIDLDRRIRRSKERLNKAARVSELGRRIEELVEKADSHGQEGRVDEAQACLREVEDLRAQRASALAPATATGEYGQSVLEKEKRMVVCDICGAMQDATDTEKRLSSHLDGKQHVGYQRIRQTVETMKAKRQEEREARNKQQEAVDNKDTSNGHHGSPAAKDQVLVEITITGAMRAMPTVKETAGGIMAMKAEIVGESITRVEAAATETSSAEAGILITEDDAVAAEIGGPRGPLRTAMCAAMMVGTGGVDLV
eukprot:jgi/Chlat1/1124/Chrsp111S01606